MAATPCITIDALAAGLVEDGLSLDALVDDRAMAEALVAFAGLRDIRLSRLPVALDQIRFAVTVQILGAFRAAA